MADVQLSIGANDDGAKDVIQAVVSALNDLRAEVTRNNTTLQQATTVSKAHTDATKATGDAAERAAAGINQMQDSASKLIERLVEIAGLTEVAETLKSFVDRGIEFSETIERATLGIAGLVNAQSTFSDATGKAVSTQDRLNVSFGVAEEQVAKIRVAALGTTATTAELLQSFQGLVAVGGQAGLSINQVRDATIGATRAATALGIPYEQVDDDLRQIFLGHVRFTNQLALGLGLTSQMVQRTQEQGNLAQVLTQEMSKFNATAGLAANTFDALKNHISNAVSTLASASTTGLQASLNAAQNLLAALTDSQTGGLTKQIQALADGLNVIATQLGRVIGTAIDSLIAGAKNLGDFFEKNATQIKAFATDAATAVIAIGGIVADAAKVALEVADWAVNSATVRAIMLTVVSLVQGIRDAFPVIVAGVVAIKVALAAAAIEAGLAGTALEDMNLAMGAFVSLANGAGIAETFATILAAINPVTAALVVAGVAIGALVLYFNRKAAAQQQQQAADLATTKSMADQAANAQVLTARYALLHDEIATGALKGDALQDAQDKLADTQKELIALGPDYKNIFDQQGQSYTQTAAQLQKLTAQRIADLNAQKAQITTQLQSVDAQIRAKAAQGLGALHPFNNAAEANLGSQASNLQDQLNAITSALNGAQAKMQTDARQAQITATQNAAQISAAALALQERVLEETIRTGARASEEAVKDFQTANEEAFKTGTLSAAAYYNGIAKLQEDGLKAQVAGLKNLQALQTKGGDLDGARNTADQIKELTDQEGRDAKAATNAISANAREQQQEILAAQRELLAAQGDTVDAAIQEIHAKYDTLIKQMQADGNTNGVQIMTALLNAKVAQAQTDAIVKQVSTAEDALKERLAAIQTQQEAGSLTQSQAQHEISAAYTQTQQVLQGYLRSLQAIQQATPSTATAAEIQKVQTEIANLGKEATKTGDDFRAFAQKAQGAFASDLSGFLDQGIDKVTSLGDAFRTLALDAVNSLRQIVSQMLANIATAQLFKAILGSGGSGGGGGVATSVGGAIGDFFSSGSTALAAEGGLISGPGTPTSDSIPARLSNGEFVMRASAVQRYGAEFMSAINAHRLPPARGRRYASGGLVTSGKAGNARGAQSRLTVGLEDGLVARHLETTDGQAAVVRSISSNRVAVKRALSI